jgi:hypothetical protein
MEQMARFVKKGGGIVKLRMQNGRTKQQQGEGKHTADEGGRQR